MLSEERKALILEYINANHAVTTTQLIERFNASEATIRRDLSEMSSRGMITKVHGGAVSNQTTIANDYNVSEREGKNIDEKRAIARYAASLIHTNDMIYIDAGTTTSLLIDYVDATNVTFVTNAIMHAQKLSAKGYKVFLTGGRLKSMTEALVGGDCYETILKYRFSLGFFGTNAVNHEDGFTTPDPDEAKIKEIALKRSLSPYILCDHEKFDLSAPVSFGSYDSACIITAGKIPASYAKDNSIIRVNS